MSSNCNTFNQGIIQERQTLLLEYDFMKKVNLEREKLQSSPIP